LPLPLSPVMSGSAAQLSAASATASQAALSWPGQLGPGAADRARDTHEADCHGQTQLVAPRAFNRIWVPRPDLDCQ
jgi:hypothetical protein